MRKILYPALIFVFVISCFRNVCAQSVSIETENNAVTGQNYTIDIVMDGFDQTTPSVSSFQWTIHYDISRLSFVSLTPVSPADGWVYNLPAQNPGKITFAVAPSAGFYAESNTLICQIVFSYSSPGFAFINWNDNPTPRHIYDELLDEYTSVNWINGGIGSAVTGSSAIDAAPIFKVFPNPADDLIFLDVPLNIRGGDVRIFSISGVELECAGTDTREHLNDIIKIETCSLPRGICIIEYFAPDNKVYRSVFQKN